MHFEYVRISMHEREMGGISLLINNWLFPLTGYRLMKYNLIPITCNFGRLLIKWALIYVLA